MRLDQILNIQYEKEERTMLGALFMALVGISLAIAAVALVVWVLRQLWGHHEEETPAQAIEIKTEPPAVEPEPPPAEAEVKEPTAESEAAEIEAEEPVEESVELETPEVEVEEEAPAPEAEAPVEEELAEPVTAEVEPEEESAAEEPEVIEMPEVEEVDSEPEAEAEEAAAPAEPDDLRRIEGIGPKIASVLQAGGITTYGQLADSTPDQLRQILEDSDPRLIRIANPDTWPEQASLAAAGDWDGLDELNRELKGGKRA
jgi:predicted flap endonuclease-1-like 5' DNA nuclease